MRAIATASSGTAKTSVGVARNASDRSLLVRASSVVTASMAMETWT